MVSKFRGKYTPEFRDTAVREVADKSRPIADVARELGLVEQTLRNWVAAHRERHGAEPQELTSVMSANFDRHPAAQIYLSQPGLGPVLAARVLGEFGDDPKRFASSRARKNYSGQRPITRASGKKSVVLARYATNRRLGVALHLQAYGALNGSAGTRAYYDTIRTRGTGHHAALRQVANRLVGILHGCLDSGTLYNEATAWNNAAITTQQMAPAA